MGCIKLTYQTTKPQLKVVHRRHSREEKCVQWFMSVDPLAEQTITPYQYTYQNPINYTDPTGMSGESIIINKETGDATYIDDGVDVILEMSSENYGEALLNSVDQVGKTTTSQEYYDELMSLGDEVDLDSDLGKIIRTVYGEFHGVGDSNDKDRKVAAESIVNRFKSGKYGKTYDEVLTPRQYNAVGKDVYNDPFGYLADLELESKYFFEKRKKTIRNNFSNAVEASYKSYNNIGNSIGKGVEFYVSPPLKSSHFDGNKQLKNITSDIKGLKGISGVWRRK